MMRSNKHLLAIMAAAVMLSGSAAQAFAAGEVPVLAEGTATTVLAVGGGPPLGTVAIEGGSFLELKNVTMFGDVKEKTAAFTITVHNESGSELQFRDYWVRVRTADGSPGTVRVLPQDQTVNRIAAHSTRDIHFYAVVNGAAELNDLVFGLIRWDFSLPNFERSLGEIAVPDNYSQAASAGEPIAVRLTDTDVLTSVSRLQLEAQGENRVSTITLTMANTGELTAAVPDYQYFVRTAAGDMYPLHAAQAKPQAIDPKRDAELKLSGSVPASVKPEGWQLVMIQEASDLKRRLPVASFQLPPAVDAAAVAAGVEYDFSTDNGAYSVKLDSLERLPWEDQDILAADVTLLNQGDAAAPIPELEGYFLLDDTVKVPAQRIQTGASAGWAPEGAVPVHFIGKIPYSRTFSTAKLVLESKTGEGENAQEEIVRLANSPEGMGIAQLQIGETYAVTEEGGKTGYTVRSIRTYKGDSSDMVTVQLEADNLEKRLTDVSGLVAQLQAADGTVYPAAVSDIPSKVNPGGSALLQLSASVPKGTPASSLQAIIGKAVTQGRYTARGETPDAYVNAAAFALPAEDKTVQDEIGNVDLSPYHFSMNHINTWLSADELKLTFNYELTRDSNIEANTEGRKLIIEFEDEQGNKTFSREFDFKYFESGGTASGTDEAGDEALTALQLGKHDGVKLIERDKDLLYKLETLKTYKLSIFDSFQGHKKLLATKAIAWFSTTD